MPADGEEADDGETGCAGAGGDADRASVAGARLGIADVADGRRTGLGRDVLAEEPAIASGGA
jgi:hypothetical protein